MSVLADSAFINASPKTVEDWLKDLPSHYTEWHPAHSKCEVFGDDITSPGTEFSFEELLHGETHHLRARVSSVSHENGLTIQYVVLGALSRSLGMKGAFQLQPNSGGCLFTATISVWPPMWLCNILFGSQMKNLAEHMKEEGENLKTILERNNPPYTV